jgi:hypothetical protein
MADVSKLKDQLAANESRRNALAAQIGPLTDDAKYAYSAWQSAESTPNETGNFFANGQSFTNKQDYVAYTKSAFDSANARRKEKAIEFNALFPEKDALEKQIAEAGSTPDAPADKEATSNVDNAATAKQEQQPTEKTNDAPSLEEQTNKELAAAYGYKDTNVTNSDPKEFKGESGKPAPDVPDSVTSSQAAQVAYDDDGHLLPGFEEDENGDAHYTADTPHQTIFKPGDAGGGAEGTGASTRASKSTASAKPPAPAEATWAGPKDMRVYIKVPSSYYKNLYSTEVQQAQGILFPYTPSISYDTQASYGSVNPLHSNYTQYFFKNSAISAIQISGKFTVQNEAEATVWMSIIEMSRLLLKMPFGADTNSGSAPPVCRLHGYGDWIFNNVPVAITSFKFDLPDGVDYIAKSQNGYGNTMVPTVSTLTYGLIPIYSRQEIRDFGIDKWLSGNLTGKGYL